MNHQVTIPTDRVHMPTEIGACEALEYLSTEGLPPHCEWRYPRRGNFFDQHHVDFTILNTPRRMSDILSGQDTPDWFLASQKWEDFLAIGTLPAETNMRRGGFDGGLHQEYKSMIQDLMALGMSRRAAQRMARSAFQSEIDALKNSPPPRPMDPDVFSQLPQNPLDQGR